MNSFQTTDTTWKSYYKRNKAHGLRNHRRSTHLFKWNGQVWLAGQPGSEPGSAVSCRVATGRILSLTQPPSCHFGCGTPPPPPPRVVTTRASVRGSGSADPRRILSPGMEWMENVWFFSFSRPLHSSLLIPTPTYAGVLPLPPQ